MDEIEGLAQNIAGLLAQVETAGEGGKVILKITACLYTVYKFVEGRNSEALHANKEAYRLAKELVQSIKATIDAFECSSKLMWCHRLSMWLRQLNNMAYDVEDMVDDDEFQIIQNKVKGKRKFSEFNFYQRKFGELLSFFTQKEHLHMYFYLKAVKGLMFPQSSMEKLGVLSERFHMFLLTANSFMELLDNVTVAQREITNPYFPCVAKFVGWAIEKEELRTLLQTETGKRRVDVIPLVGIGGVGKTALAQNVYHDVKEFELWGWVQHSGNSDITMAIRHLVQNFGKMDLPVNINLMNALNILSQTVHDRKFFLVLDDVRDNIEDQWNNLIMALESGALGSKILITTQSHKIARRIGTVKPIHLDVLESQDLLTLFEYHALIGVHIDEEIERVLRSMSRKVLRNLCGLPLAAKVIGSMLRSNLTEREWRRVSELQWWNIREALDGILPSLVVGYQQLEAGQRKCFAYCCVFPENHTFQKEKLVQMWIANDFIQPNDQEVVTMEDTGRQWFDDLVEKSFIQQLNENNEFTLSDLMRGLSAVVSTAHNFSLTQESSIPTTTRHLALPAGKLDVLCDIDGSSNLRTIILSGPAEINKTNVLNDVFRKLDCLRVLQLSCITMQELPYAIRYLLHLRYLDLSHTKIKYLHPYICKCYHLQVLDLRGCNFKSLPDGMTDLINLRHLYADSNTISLISGIGQLANLQELNEFRIGKIRGHKITELKNMRFLRGELRIMGIENVGSREEASEANLIEKKNLNLIGFYQKPSNRPNFSKQVLEALQPHPNLKELIFSGYEGYLLPNWVSELTSIQKLTLEYCPELDSMVGLPPILEELVIKGCPEELMVQCMENGSEWRNIKHARKIMIGGNQIK